MRIKIGLRAGVLLAVLAALAVLAVLPAPATAHSGGLDRFGGHHCWTRCASKGYRYGQYHCHRNTRACKKALRRHRRHGH